LCNGTEEIHPKNITDITALINYRIQTEGIVELKGDYREDKTFRIRSINIDSYTRELREASTTF